MTTKERVNFCAEIQKKHGQKIVFAVVSLFIIIQFGGSAVCAVILFCLSAMGDIGSLAAIVVAILLYIGIFALHSGFSFIMLKLIRGQNVILGDMFLPFRNFKRTAKTSLPFLLSILVTCFAASIVLISSGTFEALTTIMQQAMQENVQIETQTDPSAVILSLSLILGGFIFVTLLLNLPLIYLPFFDYDMQNKPPKEVRKTAFALFKESFKKLFTGCFFFAGKNIAAFLVFYGIKILNIKILSDIAAFFSSIFLFFAYASVMLMAACIFQDYTQPEAEFEVLAIEDGNNE